MASSEIRTSSEPSNPAEGFIADWWLFDGSVAVALLVLMTLLESPLQDGDGMAVASSAIRSSLLEGMTPKHALQAPVLRLVFLTMQTLGHKEWSIPAFLLIMHLCGVGIYLTLSRGIYPLFMACPLLARACGIGTVLSYGVLSRSIALEHYAPALLSILLLVTLLLNARPTRLVGIVGGLLFVLAVGIHVTNVLVFPFLVTLIWARGGQRPRVLQAFLLTGLFAGLLLLGMIHLGRAGRLWPLDLKSIIPEPDPHPVMGVSGRMARAGYGFVRSIAYLPYIRDTSKRFLGAFSITWLMVALGLAVSAGLHRARWKDRPGELSLLLLYILPFVGMGLRYYPSDPERWLFLTPVVWLIIGWIVGDHARDAHRPRAAIVLLWAGVLALGGYNILADVLPTRLENPNYNLLKVLAQTSRPGDLILTHGGGIHSDFLRDYVLGMPIEGDNVAVYDLAARHRDDHEALAQEIRSLVRNRIEARRRVLVPGFFDEPLHEGEGYPWAHIMHWGIGPETIREALAPFTAVVLVPRHGKTPAVYELKRREAAEPGQGTSPK